MIKDDDQIKSVEVEIAPEESMNLLESFQYASEQLENLRERMEKRDRKLYRAIGEYMDSTDQTIQNLAAEALDPTIVSDPLLNPSPPDFQKDLPQLQARYTLIRSEFNSLLLTAYTNEEIDRLKNLNDLTHLISTRIQELSTPNPETQHPLGKTTAKPKVVSMNDLKSQFSSLEEAKKALNIKARSWKDLVDKLNS
jgi:hypothetical protein